MADKRVLAHQDSHRNSFGIQSGPLDAPQAMASILFQRGRKSISTLVLLRLGQASCSARKLYNASQKGR